MIRIQHLWDPAKQPIESEAIAAAIRKHLEGYDLDNTEIEVTLVMTTPYDFYRGEEDLRVDDMIGGFAYETHYTGHIFPAHITYRVWLDKEPVYL